MMRRAFWITLLAGYIGGLLGAVFYLPRAILAPSLANLLLLTLVSTAVITVVAWRTVSNEDIEWRLVWRRLASSLGFDGPSPAVAAGPTLVPLSAKPVARRPAAQPTPQPEPMTRLLVDDWTPDTVSTPMPVHETKPAPPTPALASAAVQAPKLKKPARQDSDLLLEALPLVQLPQRRPAGYRVRSALRDGVAALVDRRGLIRNGLGVDSLVRFDRHTLERFVDMAEQSDLPLRGAAVVFEIGQETLRSRKSRRVIDRLVNQSSTLGFNLTFVIDVAADTTLPRLRADLLGPQVELILQGSARLDVEAKAINPKVLMDSGFSGIALDYEDLLPFLSLPVENDPMFARLNGIEEQGGRVLLEGFEAESCLRDVFDYPCHWGTGSIFGEVLPVVPAAKPNAEDAEIAEATLAAQQLLGRLGYGASA